MGADDVSDRLLLMTALRAGENQHDYRERMTVMRAEAVERRQRELDEQSSPAVSPSDRIRIWERLHQLSLPTSPQHRLIAVISADTRLSLDEVRAEQQLRASPRPTAENLT